MTATTANSTLQKQMTLLKSTDQQQKQELLLLHQQLESVTFDLERTKQESVNLHQQSRQDFQTASSQLNSELAKTRKERDALEVRCK